MELNYDEKINVILIGDSTVGKTSIIKQYFEEQMIGNYLATAGVEQYSKNLNMNGKLIKLKVWDTAGQERYRSLTKNFYKNAQGVIIVYDVSNRESFRNIKIWIDSIHENKTSDSVKIIVVGNKIDLPREVSNEEAKKYCESNNMIYLETSAKRNIGVEDIFKKITYLVLETKMDLIRDSAGEMRLTMKKEKFEISENKVKDNKNNTNCQC